MTLPIEADAPNDRRIRFEPPKWAKILYFFDQFRAPQPT